MDKDKIWKKTLGIVKDQVSLTNFKGWFRQIHRVEFTDKDIILTVPSAFIKNQLISRYGDLIKKSLFEVTEIEFNLIYQIDSSITLKEVAEESEQITDFALTGFNHPNPPSLNIKYTFKNFVVGLTNNLAYAASQAVVQNPGISYNPLFIYGPSGVGKTHLMQAIGHALFKKNPYLKINFAPSERFMNDFVESIRNKKTGDFRNKYRSCNLLLIDDIQFISGKDSTQEEFFHTFNDLQSKNVQIVLTSDRSPNEIEKLEDRLKSRFQGGLMVDIQLADFDTRIAILKAKLLEKGGNLPEDCIRLIAESIKSNTRELEGKLTQITQNLNLTKERPTLEYVKKFLNSTISSSPSLDYKKVLNEVNNYFNIKMSDLIGPRRQKQLVTPRQIAMYLLYIDCKLSMEKIGTILGGRDHTTVLHGIEKIKFSINRDRELQRYVIDLQGYLRN